MNLPVAVRLIATLMLIAVIVTLSVVPGRVQSGDSAFVRLVAMTPAPLQKLMHTIAYAGLALLWMWTLESVESRIVRIALTLIATIGLGAVLEWHQTRVPGRFGTLFDVALNALGALLGLAMALLLL